MDSSALLCLHIFVSVFLGIQGASEWGYFGNKGPSHWGDVNSLCSTGSRQSPIDLSKPTHKDLGAFTFTNYDSSNGLTYDLTNNGHTVKMDFAGTPLPKVSGGGLSGDYEVAQLHFHWGSVDTKGSEHTINGKKFPMELHIVHYKSSYGSLSAAVPNADGLAVLGFMFEVEGVSTEHPGMKKVIDHLTDVTAIDGTKTIPSFSLGDLIPARSVLKDFYRYPGSLTTPGCNEVVTWTVFTPTIKITKAQLAEFRKLQFAETNENGNNDMVDNYRPVVSLGSRTIESSFEASSATRPITAIAALFISFLVKTLF